MDPVRPPKGPLAGQSTTARSSRHAASPPRSEIVPPRRACTRTPDTVWVRRSRVPASHQRAPLPPGTQPLPRGPLCSRNVRDRAWGTSTGALLPLRPPPSREGRRRKGRWPPRQVAVWPNQGPTDAPRAPHDASLLARRASARRSRAVRPLRKKSVRSCPRAGSPSPTATAFAPTARSLPAVASAAISSPTS